MKLESKEFLDDSGNKYNTWVTGKYQGIFLTPRFGIWNKSFTGYSKQDLELQIDQPLLFYDIQHRQNYFA